MQNEIYIQTYWYQIYAMHVDIYMREILANAGLKAFSVNKMCN